MSNLDQTPLGKNSNNPSQYSPELLFPIARIENRLKIGIKNPEPPFFGIDI
jgi:7-cyano-7-deazaguanine reductase